MQQFCLFMLNIRKAGRSLLYYSISILIFYIFLSFIIAENNFNKDGQEVVEQASVKQSEASNSNKGPKAFSADLAASILARPLFEPGRRPPAKAQEPALAMPRLAGIVISPGYSAAIFQKSSSTRPIVLKTGEVLENLWNVAGIAASEVTLAHDDTVLVLTPLGAADKGPPSPEPSHAWKIGLRRSDPLPSYLHRQR